MYFSVIPGEHLQIRCAFEVLYCCTHTTSLNAPEWFIKNSMNLSDMFSGGATSECLPHYPLGSIFPFGLVQLRCQMSPSDFGADLTTRLLPNSLIKGV